jgi:uncharacterized protein
LKTCLVKAANKYNIDIFRLNEGVHHYQFAIDNDFFSLHEQDLIEKGEALLNLTLNRSSTMMQLKFEVKGTVELVCDRSLRTFNEPLDFTENLVIKFGEEYLEVSEDVVIIPEGSQKLNIASFLFEYIALALPMKKLHPDLRIEEDGDDWDEEDIKLVYSSSTADVEEKETDKLIDEEKIDPRWSVLKKLKKDN